MPRKYYWREVSQALPQAVLEVIKIPTGNTRVLLSNLLASSFFTSFRKRIPGFCLLCVFASPPHGPWCQLRSSVQCTCEQRADVQFIALLRARAALPALTPALRSNSETRSCRNGPSRTKIRFSDNENSSHRRSSAAHTRQFQGETFCVHLRKKFSCAFPCEVSSAAAAAATLQSPDKVGFYFKQTFFSRAGRVAMVPDSSSAPRAASPSVWTLHTDADKDLDPDWHLNQLDSLLTPTWGLSIFHPLILSHHSVNTLKNLNMTTHTSKLYRYC